MPITNQWAKLLAVYLPRGDCQNESLGKTEAVQLCCREGARTFLNGTVPRKNHKAGFKMRFFSTSVNGPSFILAFGKKKTFQRLLSLDFSSLFSSCCWARKPYAGAGKGKWDSPIIPSVPEMLSFGANCPQVTLSPVQAQQPRGTEVLVVWQEGEVASVAGWVHQVYPLFVGKL